MKSGPSAKATRLETTWIPTPESTAMRRKPSRQNSDAMKDAAPKPSPAIPPITVDDRIISGGERTGPVGQAGKAADCQTTTAIGTVTATAKPRLTSADARVLRDRIAAPAPAGADSQSSATAGQAMRAGSPLPPSVNRGW